MVPAVDGGVVKSDTRIPSILLHGIQKSTAALRTNSSWKLRNKEGVISHVVDPFLYPFSWEATGYILSIFQ